MRRMLLLLLVAPALFAQGRKLFEAQCALCHGANGGGGRGPSLLTPTLARAPDDAALEKLIAEGLGAEMPGAWQLSPNEVKQLATYVRSLGRVQPEPVPGDPAHGRDVYRRHGCANCHMVAGQGNGTGPELTNIGLRRSAAHLRESVVSPASVLPDGFLMMKAGALTGVRVAEDPFHVWLQDAAGRYHTVRKGPGVALEKLPGRSPMPAYPSLPPADLQDLVAYLASLKGVAP